MAVVVATQEAVPADILVQDIQVAPHNKEVTQALHHLPKVVTLALHHLHKVGTLALHHLHKVVTLALLQVLHQAEVTEEAMARRLTDSLKSTLTLRPGSGRWIRITLVKLPLLN